MASLEIESTLTDRYQTTVPDAVRRTLRLRKRDKIRYVVQPDGAGTQLCVKAATVGIQSKQIKTQPRAPELTG